MNDSGEREVTMQETTVGGLRADQESLETIQHSFKKTNREAPKENKNPKKPWGPHLNLVLRRYTKRHGCERRIVASSNSLQLRKRRKHTMGAWRGDVVVVIARRG
jgi:hypothetical protein